MKILEMGQWYEMFITRRKENGYRPGIQILLFEEDKSYSIPTGNKQINRFFRDSNLYYQWVVQYPALWIEPTHPISIFKPWRYNQSFHHWESGTTAKPQKSIFCTGEKPLPATAYHSRPYWQKRCCKVKQHQSQITIVVLNFWHVTRRNIGPEFQRKYYLNHWRSLQEGSYQHWNYSPTGNSTVHQRQE